MKPLSFFLLLTIFAIRAWGQQVPTKKPLGQRLTNLADKAYNKQQHENAINHAILNRWVNLADKEVGSLDLDSLFEIPQTDNLLNSKNQKVGEWLIWYDANGKEIPDSTNAAMFRIINFNDKGNVKFFSTVRDYYFPSRYLMFVGYMKTLYPVPIYDGNGYWFYENGSPKEFRKIYPDNNNVVKSIQWDTTGKPKRIDYFANGKKIDIRAKMDSTLLFTNNQKSLKIATNLVVEQDRVNYGTNSLEYAYSSFLHGIMILPNSTIKKAGPYFVRTSKILESNSQIDSVWFFSTAMARQYYEYLQDEVNQQRYAIKLIDGYRKLLPTRCDLMSIKAIQNNFEADDIYSLLYFSNIKWLLNSYLLNNKLDKADALLPLLKDVQLYIPKETSETGKQIKVNCIYNLGFTYQNYHKDYNKAKAYFAQSIQLYDQYKLNDEVLQDGIFAGLIGQSDTVTLYKIYGNAYKTKIRTNDNYSLSRLAMGQGRNQDLLASKKRGYLDDLFFKFDAAQSEKEYKTLIKQIIKRLLELDKQGLSLSPVRATLINHLGNLYEAIGDIRQAKIRYQESFDLYKLYGKTVLNFMSESEKEIFFAQNIIPVLASSEPDQYEEQRIYDYVLLKKGIVLNDTRNIINAIYESTDTTLIRLWESFLVKRSALSESTNELHRMQQQSELEMLEKQIGVLSLPFKKNTDNLNITSKDIARSLDKNSVAIEFNNTTISLGESPDSSFYYALVLDNTHHIENIPLCTQAQLAQILNEGGDTQEKRFSRGVLGEGSADNSLSTLKKLSQLIWQKIEPHLVGKSTIYFSPSGLLHQIPFAAMPIHTDSSRTISQKYNFIQMLSTRTIAQNTDSLFFKPSMSFALYGGIDYGQVANNYVANAIVPERGNYFRETAQVRTSNWAPLPATKTEVESIANTLIQNGVTNLSIKTDTMASEISVKYLSDNSPTIFHSATHGFFLPQADSTNIRPSSSLLRSGLIFSNANTAWTDTDGKLRIPT
jgi:hypothetical protein